MFVRGCNVRTCFPAIECGKSAPINESGRNKSAEVYNGFVDFITVYYF